MEAAASASDPRDREHRATFIVRLSKIDEAAWHGIVELIGGEWRRYVSGPEELTSFIDRAFAASPAGDRKETPR